jgi:predicted RNA binding protein YcfA (HicA-like mRNA interferase family)
MPAITPVSGRRLRRVFELAGFTCVRTEGDHFVLTKSGLSRPVAVPDYQAVPVFVIRNCLRTARLSREDYFRLLQEA